MSEYLTVESLEFSYGLRKIIHNFNFQVQKGELVGVIGPNGAGKSTLLHLLAGLLFPDKGKIYLGGRETTFLSRRKWAQKAALVFQDVPSELDMDCLEVVMMGRFPYITRWKGEDELDYQVVQKVMKATSVQNFIGRSFQELSGGEKQRVMVARALAQEPELLLLDEPTSHLDVRHQLEIMDILLELKKEGIAILGVFHDLNLVSQFCDKVLLLREGCLLNCGKTTEVMKTPQIEELFQVEFLEALHPFTFRPFFMPLGKRKSESNNIRLHLICGGGSGRLAMQELLSAGFSLSVGVVNQLDSDQELAEKLGLKLVTEKPFTHYSSDSLQRAQTLAEQADFVIVVPTYWGEGNLGNLRLAQQLLARGKRVILFRDCLGEQWDYTNGRALKILHELVEAGALVFDSWPAAIRAIGDKPPITPEKQRQKELKTTGGKNRQPMA
ncbi:MAG: cobalamin transport system ATP-binding protein [Candidatus Atribacteria bacterium]|nr:cobalamin transport system ATP-binding protein [Candidatus Atribacteria bacterium]